MLKIDRSFVSGITDTTEAVALVHAMVQLGKALGLETVAEGSRTPRLGPQDGPPSGHKAVT